MLYFLTTTNDLDRKVPKVIENILFEPPSQDPIGFQLIDVADMNQGFPPENFFGRAMLSFRLPRRSSDLNWLNPISEEDMDAIPLSEDQKNGRMLREQIWSLLLLGAAATRV